MWRGEPSNQMRALNGETIYYSRGPVLDFAPSTVTSGELKLNLDFSNATRILARTRTTWPVVTNTRLLYRSVEEMQKTSFRTTSGRKESSHG
jgi:hypothetical protein